MKEQLAKAEESVAKLQANRNDRWYPTFHIAAPGGWINDPNGVSFFKGRYHVYFQHNPFSTHHATMHWGHVSSTDMVTWKREPIAFAPSIEADRDGVFSGSAVSSDDGDTMYVYYTGHRWANGVNEDEGNDQVQCLATSQDAISFEKQGVVVRGPEELPHFRDPKVWKMGDTWYMVFGACSVENRGEVWLYTSANMEDWEFDSILFRDPDPEAFMLECPDFFPLGDKWVLVYCPMGPAISGYANRNGHNAGYVVGTWAPGEPFIQTKQYDLEDWGHNFYAPQSFESPDGRRIQYGWMGSFNHPLASQEADGWSGQLTVGRELSLNADGALTAWPIAEVEDLRVSTTEIGPVNLGFDESLRLVDDATAVDIELEIDLAATTANRVGLQVHKTEDGHHSYVYYDDLAGRVGIDGRLSYAGESGYRAAAVNPGADNKLQLRILVDRGSIEVFVNHGEATVTSFSFPADGPRAIELCSEAGTAAITDLRVHSLRSIWEN
ncbi:MAG: glycoside hydrolase family 32 protein [Ancrocorticia sp.]|uniref:glycoside hydrolase family 32 protein n=1 Tax=Ancrocorticia sp. TaxID=2593684 RepID=UPI003F926F41